MSSQSDLEYKDALVPFFLLTFAITWGIGALAIFLPVQYEAIFGEISDRHRLYYFAVAAPTLSATILTFTQEGRTGLTVLYSRLIRWRFGIQWYALVLVGIPCLGWLVSRVAGASPLKDFDTTSQFLMLLLYLLITGPLGEELGWRGSALPRLLGRFNPFVASLVLGLIWGVWHLPSFFLSGMVQSNGLALPVFIFGSVCMSFLATWIFQHTGGSVLIPDRTALGGLIDPGVDADAAARHVHAASAWGTCAVDEVLSGGSDRGARVRLACSRGKLDLAVEVDPASGKVRRLALAPAAAGACVP